MEKIRFTKKIRVTFYDNFTNEKKFLGDYDTEEEASEEIGKIIDDHLEYDFYMGEQEVPIMKKYIVTFYNNYEDRVEVFGDYDTEEEAFEAIEGYPELDFWVSKQI